MSASLRVFTGAAAATMSAAQTAVSLLSVDAATNDPGSHKIAPGTNSFEKYVAVYIDAAAGTTYSNFYVECGSSAPAGVTIKVGFADAGATPTAATSTVAKTTLSPGRRYLWDDTVYDTTGQTTRFLVVQALTSPTVTPGAIPQITLTFGWSVG